MLDFTTSFGKRVATLLANEQEIWLTTVNAEGVPQPTPVWFLWENDSFLVYTKPGSPKVANLKRSPKVSLNFGTGDPVAIFTCDVQMGVDVSPASKAAYLEKYHQGILDIKLTDETMLQEYSLALRITPTKLRGF